MKRTILNSAIIGVAALFVFSACKKEEESTAVLVENSVYSVKISGIVEADLTDQNDTSGGVEVTELEPVANMKILFQVAAADYIDGSTSTTIKTFTATTSSTGTYSISIPVPGAGTNVTIKPIDFEYMYEDYKFDGATTRVLDEKTREIYTVVPVVLAVEPNDVIIQDFQY